MLKVLNRSKNSSSWHLLSFDPYWKHWILMFPFKPQSLGEAKWAKQLSSTGEFEVKHLLYTESNAC